MSDPLEVIFARLTLTLDFAGHHKWREREVSFTRKVGRRVGVRTPDLCRVKAALYR